ncbi:MAG: hypothetical protein GPJ54_02390 [Candidatus Heimdallarchaeota archaeon]|nr:hypothetical protein [Candidatus Heimdallarchaeota archaeon]
MLLQINTKEKKDVLSKSLDSNSPVTHNFQHYIENTYGKGILQALRYENQRLFSHYSDIFGDVVFQLMVNKVGEKLHLPIDFILHDFSSYLNDLNQL